MPYDDILVTIDLGGVEDSVHLPPDTDPMDIEMDVRAALCNLIGLNYWNAPKFTILAVRYPDGQLIEFD